MFSLGNIKCKNSKFVKIIIWTHYEIKLGTELLSSAIGSVLDVIVCPNINFNKL